MIYQIGTGLTDNYSIRPRVALQDLTPWIQRVLFKVLESCLTFLNSGLFYNTNLYYNVSNTTATPRELKFLRNLGGFFLEYHA